MTLKVRCVASVLTLAICSLIALNGCGVQRNGVRQSAAVPPVLRNAAGAVLLGSAYERGVKAVQDENVEHVVVQRMALEQLNAPTAANHIASDAATTALEQAIWFDRLAQIPQNPHQQQYQALATAHYRAAFQMAPHFTSDDSQNLNALGYFLADQGNTPNDFQEAERLTRRAVQLKDQEVANIDTSFGPHLESVLFPELKAQTRLQRATIRDSLAWSLYRLGRYQEACAEQETAVKESIAVNALADPELYYHLGAIYQALHRPAEARQQYQEALRLDPHHAASQQALANLTKASVAIKPGLSGTKPPNSPL